MRPSECKFGATFASPSRFHGDYEPSLPPHPFGHPNGQFRRTRHRRSLSLSLAHHTQCLATTANPANVNRRSSRFASCLHYCTMPYGTIIPLSPSSFATPAISQNATGQLSRRTDGSTIANPPRHQNHPRPFPSHQPTAAKDQISFTLIFFKMLRLKSRGPPKRRISEVVIRSPSASRRSIR